MRNTLFILLFLTQRYISAQQESIIVKSEFLPRDVKVITYDSDPNVQVKPIVYITDGEKFINNGSLQVIKDLTSEGKISKAYYVFVSTKDPEKDTDYRNEYFFTNPNYLSFFEEELIPEIEKDLLDISSKKRSHVGISFGGLNAAFFSAKSTKFKNFGVLSPILYPRENVYQDITFSENSNLKIFLSTGKNDAEVYTDKLKRLYKSKDYKLMTIYTEGGHNFNNWNKQLEKMLNFFLQ